MLSIASSHHHSLKKTPHVAKCWHGEGSSAMEITDNAHPQIPGYFCIPSSTVLGPIHVREVKQSYYFKRRNILTLKDVKRKKTIIMANQTNKQKVKELPTMFLTLKVKLFVISSSHFMKDVISCSVVANSLRPHGL